MDLKKTLPIIDNLPRITVITPTYNQSRYIEQTINSVLNQNYANLEYIVIDGLSSDNTIDILRKYQHKLKYLSEKDRGQTHAINKGLVMATGEIICWLNSDDYFLPGTLNAVGNYFMNYPSALWITGDCKIIDENNHETHNAIRYYKLLLRHFSPNIYLGLTNAICQPSTFWRKSTHLKLGELNENLRYTMDYDWWLRLNQLSPAFILTRSLSAFRVHKDSKGGNSFIAQFTEDFDTLNRYYFPKFIKKLHLIHNKIIIYIYKIIK